MLRFHPSRFGWILVLTLGLWAVAVQAQEFRYRYVSLSQVELPPGFSSFFPSRSTTVVGFTALSTTTCVVSPCRRLRRRGRDRPPARVPCRLCGQRRRHHRGQCAARSRRTSSSKPPGSRRSGGTHPAPARGVHERRHRAERFGHGPGDLVRCLRPADLRALPERSGDPARLRADCHETVRFPSASTIKESSLGRTLDLPSIGDRGFRFDPRTGETSCSTPSRGAARLGLGH